MRSLLVLALAAAAVRAGVDSSQADVPWDSPKTIGFDPIVWVYLIRDGVTKEQWDRLSDAERASLIDRHAKEAGKRGEGYVELSGRCYRSDLSPSDIADAAAKIREAEDWLAGTKPRSRAADVWLKTFDEAAGSLAAAAGKLPPGTDATALAAAQSALDGLKTSQAALMAADPSAAAAGFDGSSQRGAPGQGGASGATLRPGGLGPDETTTIDEEKRRRLAEGGAPPTPEEAKRRELIDRIVSRTIGDGVPPERKAESERLRREELADVPTDVLERMDADRSHMILVSDGKKIGDMPQSNGREPASFPLSLLGCTKPASFAPTLTVDGRSISASNADGLAEIPQGDGSLACFARVDRDRRWPQASTEVHEWGHMVKHHLSDADKSEVRRLYEEARAGKAPFSDDYAAVNENEYFAVATEIWFGVHDQLGVHKDASWIVRNQPGLASLLRKVYGPARSALPTQSGG